MRLPSVDLDDETVGPPEEVDLESIDLHIHRRFRQAASPTHGSEELLQIGPRAVDGLQRVDCQPEKLSLSARRRKLCR